MTRVRRFLERSRQTFLEPSGRSPALDRYRATVADLLGPARSAPSRTFPTVYGRAAHRDLDLLDSLLSQLETMEAGEDDPNKLAGLYNLDHLATRLRRSAENVCVLTGADTGRSAGTPAAVVDVVRASISAVEHYDRVTLGQMAPLGITGAAANDVGRLVAELLDNATRHGRATDGHGHAAQQPAATVSAHLTEHGSVLVRVVDDGAALPDDRLATLNRRLRERSGSDTARGMGLAVAQRLASRHGLQVWLSRRSPTGTIASVLLPTALVQDSPRDRETPRTRETSTATERPGATASTSDDATAAPHREPSASALPKRTPRRPAAPPNPGANSSASADRSGGHKRLLADLADFSAGMRAARRGTNDSAPYNGHDGANTDPADSDSGVDTNTERLEP